MSYDDDRNTETIPVKLPNGSTIQIEVSSTGREDVAFAAIPFKQITDQLEGIVGALKESLERIKPDKAMVKFGIEMAVEAGNLTAMIVKGTGKGNLEITLEWNKNRSDGKTQTK